jgi:hypothetical protein
LKVGTILTGIIAAVFTVAAVAILRNPEAYVRLLLPRRVVGVLPRRARERYESDGGRRAMAAGAAVPLLVVGLAAWIGLVVQLSRV